MDGCGGYLLTGIKVNPEKLQIETKENESSTKRTKIDQREKDVKTEEKDTNESATKKMKVDQEEIEIKSKENNSSESPTEKTMIDQK